MAKKKNGKLEQKKRDFFSLFKLYRRRIEYAVFISFIFIFIGYGVNAIKTNDYSEIREFFTLSYRALNDIAIHIIPIGAIFAVISLSVASLVHPKVVQFIGTVLIISALAIVFVIPHEITKQYVSLIISFFILNKEIFTVLGILIAFFMILIKKTRGWLIHTIKYGFEIALISVVFYFGGLYQKFDLISFLGDYWKAFQYGVSYLQGFTDVAILVYLAIVFILIYSSTGRAVRFHIRNHRANKLAKNEYGGFKDRNAERVQLLLEKDYLPMIGICVPAYNERPTAPKTLDSILACDYPIEKREIIIVADGSTDGTPDVVAERYDMVKIDDISPVFKVIPHKPVKEVWISRRYKNLKMIVKKNGGKFDALNVGLQYFSSEIKYMAVIDADTTLSKNAFKLLATEAKRNPKVVALAGAILPRDEHKWYQGKKSVFTNWQLFDYLCSFHISRGALSYLNAMMIVSGAYGFFDRYAVLSVNGYKESLGEDIYLTLELQNNSKSSIIKYVPDAIAYTQVPTTFDMVRKQRMRWFKGLTEALGAFGKMWVKNRRMAIAFAEFFVIEWVTPLLAPYGFATLLAKPDMIHSTIFQIAMGMAILTPMIQGFIGTCIEASYRTVKWRKLIFLPIQMLMSPLVVLWRNDGLMDFSSKAWGKMTRS